MIFVDKYRCNYI